MNHMFYCEVKGNESIFNQGDPANSFFILGRTIELNKIHNRPGNAGGECQWEAEKRIKEKRWFWRAGSTI